MESKPGVGPLDGYPLFWHWHPVRFEGVGPMGWWFTQASGERVLVPSDGTIPVCFGKKPRDGRSPCLRCGWKARRIRYAGDHWVIDDGAGGVTDLAG